MQNQIFTSFCTEPLYLYGEGEYNLNVVKEVKATDSYLGMKQSERSCDPEEDLQDCTTRHYISSLMTKCRCLPFTIATKADYWLYLPQSSHAVFTCRVKLSVQPKNRMSVLRE